jgi:hypothetical protein
MKPSADDGDAANRRRFARIKELPPPWSGIVRVGVGIGAGPAGATGRLGRSAE